MQTPPEPHDEDERLAYLRSLSILDTKPEERFDRITRMVARYFDVPIALISLVDADRQWFKSCVGLQVSETPRQVSFCAHAINQDDPLIIADTLADPRFATNPLVTGAPHIRFYAGIPLAGRKNMKLGTLCIVDQKPRQLSKSQLEAFKEWAKAAEDELAQTDVNRLDKKLRA